MACTAWLSTSLTSGDAGANPNPNPTPNQALQAAQAHLASPHALGAGSVFSWGRGEFGALGHGDTKACLYITTSASASTSASTSTSHSHSHVTLTHISLSLTSHLHFTLSL